MTGTDGSAGLFEPGLDSRGGFLTRGLGGTADVGLGEGADSSGSESQDGFKSSMSCELLFNDIMTR